MGQKLNKFFLLIWKNWKQQYHKPLQTLVEILAPIIFSILLVFIRSIVNPVKRPSQMYLPFHPMPLHLVDIFSIKNNDTFLKNATLVYSPSPNKIIDNSMSILKMAFHDVKGYRNSNLMENHIMANNIENIFAGVVFDDELVEKDYIPDNVEVSLRFPAELRSTLISVFSKHISDKNKSKGRSGSTIEKISDIFRVYDWKTNLLYPVYQSPGPRAPDYNNGAVPKYYAEGFLALQLAITYLLILVQDSSTHQDLPIIYMRRFPHAAWIDDPLLPALINFTGIIFVLSFVYTCINTVKLITNEKEKQLKETMKIMGLPNWLHWTAWFIKSLSFLLISISCMVFLLTFSFYQQSNFKIFTYSNPIILFLFLLLYICATITFCFSASVFFSKANTAATVAGLLWFLSYCPYLFLQTQYDQISLTTKLLVSLGSNTAMAYGFQMFLMYEGISEGIQWSNIWKPIAIDDKLNLGLIMVMLTVDTFLYLIIAIYVEKVFPGEYGTPLPWYFPVTLSYWYGPHKHEQIIEEIAMQNIDKEFFEENFASVPSIQIKNLRKVYGKKVAVNELTLNIYENQITVLLGHNGAGKTSTMSILTGIIPPTSGTAYILGFDIRTEMKQIRANLGLCPQHNILFDDLTVEEHFYFFGKLKGLHRNKILKESNKYINLLQLQSKVNKKVKTLSGGMKRKLCVGIALCGDSKIVLLDEPTAGVDPSSRRALWDLLKDEKNERCILLTTHYMDEADILGDRIAIMSNGNLKCCGSSFFLKKKFGSGYLLILEKLNCDPQHITEFLQQYIPDLQIYRNAGAELIYLLKEDYLSIFEAMLNDLENNLKPLGIGSYGISLPNLEDVFTKAGNDYESFQNIMNEKTKTINFSSPRVSVKKGIAISKLELILNQVIAMLIKKYLIFIRSWLLQFIQISIPVVFIIVAILAARNMQRNRLEDLPKLRLSLDSYENPTVLIQENGRNEYNKICLENLSKYQVKILPNIHHFMMNITRFAPSLAAKHYLIGISFKNKSNTNYVTVWFNNNPYHTPPLALGIVLNTIYKKLLGQNHSINFANYPLPFSPSAKIEKLLKGNSMGFQIAFNIGFSMAFVSSFYILFYVKERICKSKHLQFVSGVKTYIFWTTSFICDLLSFLLTIIAMLITLFSFQEEGFKRSAELGRMFLLLFCFGFSVLPMIYFASHLFDIPSTGYTRMTLFSVLTGVTAFLIVQILSFPKLLLKHVADVLHWCFLIIPHYSLATGIRDNYVTFASMKMCKLFVENCRKYKTNSTQEVCWNLACKNNFTNSLTNFCCEKEEHYFKLENPGVGKNMIYMLLFGTTLFILLNLFEKKKRKNCCVNRPKTSLEVLNEDKDVLDEKNMIRTTPETQLVKNYNIILKDLTKYYKNFLAVNGICLGVKKYECFGFLGVNGAGKTSTFKMITGDTNITSGNAWIQGFNVRSHLKDVQKLIGYCPQFDALLTDLTAKETLIIFALLRGIPRNECKYLAKKLAQDFDFYQHINKKIQQLSGGNKRKLSTAIALIGDPPVICLDEPTAGVDPVTKRYLWDTLCAVRDSGKSILFTSHSMEECEALCTRLAIMVNGEFKCLGSLQNLKEKFAVGYNLTLKIKEMNEIEAIEQFIAENIPMAKQVEKYQQCITYHIKNENIRCSTLFGILEKAKNILNIEDYYLGQTNLEQIFLNLTKMEA